MLKMCLKKKEGVCLVEILIFFLRRHARLLMASLVMFQYRVGAFMQYENSDGWCILLQMYLNTKDKTKCVLLKFQFFSEKIGGFVK